MSKYVMKRSQEGIVQHAEERAVVDHVGVGAGETPAGGGAGAAGNVVRRRPLTVVRRGGRGATGEAGASQT